MDFDSFPSYKNREAVKRHLQAEYAYDEYSQQRGYMNRNHRENKIFMHEWAVLVLGATLLVVTSVVVIKFQQAFDMRGRAFFVKNNTLIIEAEKMTLASGAQIKHDSSGNEYVEF